MKDSKNILWVLLLAFLVSITACSEKQPGWQGSIEDENGIRVVKNPLEPMYGELILNLEEDLSIGSSEDDNYAFYRIRDIKVDNDGNIYVLEFGNVRVQKFDPNGKYLCTIGKKGQGPGEYTRPHYFMIDENRHAVLVQQMNKLIVFDKDGNHLDQDITLENWVSDLHLDDSGSMWGKFSVTEDEEDLSNPIIYAIGKINAEGKNEKRVAEFPWDLHRESVNGGVIVTTSGHEYEIKLTAVNEQNLVYGYSKDYKLNIIDLEGNIHTRIEKEEPPREFSAEDKKESRRVKLPEYKPYFYRLFSDDEGRIYARRQDARMTEEIEREFDIFSRDGYYLYKWRSTLAPFVIKKGFLYTRIADEETGDVFVKRFRIKNWDQIKTGID